MKIAGILSTLVLVAGIGCPVAISTYPPTAHAQTNGMVRRDDRRDTRQDSRSVKHSCNTQADKSRAECRQTKRDVKQQGRATR